jgi:hypothetical protein
MLAGMRKLKERIPLQVLARVKRKELKVVSAGWLTFPGHSFTITCGMIGSFGHLQNHFRYC